jgi:hypothetical protein
LAIKNGQRYLLKILEDHKGRVSNRKAIEALSERLKRPVERDEYEHVKEQLLSSGTIKKTTGRGGCIELISSESDNSQMPSSGQPFQVSQGESENDKVNQLMTSLAYLPGARAKQNKKTITLLCGDDNDKLFCGWDHNRKAFYVQYRMEAGRVDHSDLAERLFREVTSDMVTAEVVRSNSAITVYVGTNVALCNKTIKRLMSRLDDVTLDNAPQSAYETSKPRSDRYYAEVAQLIKFCVDNKLAWPLKNWRKTLGFDDVDDLTVIGRSNAGIQSPYREHIVPACLIKEEALKMAERGENVASIANFIRHHLYVVIISPSEAQLLNLSHDAGGMSVKTTMPEGWIFGDDPTERLKAAGIQIRYDNHTLPEWKPKKPGKRELIKKLLFGSM